MGSIAASTLSDLQWNQIREALASRAKTDLGRARALARPFFDHPEQARSCQALQRELRNLAVEERLTLPLWGIRDVRTPLERAAKRGMLEPAELLGCAAVIQALGRARDFAETRRESAPRVWEIASRIEDLGTVATRIERSFESSGEISDSASPELRELRERTRSLHRSIKAKVDALLHDEQFVPLLRETYFTIRNERYVLPVLASARSQVPGIVHNASQSGQTLFVEPQALIGLGNELAIAQSMVLEEERRILQELSGLLGRNSEAILRSLDAAAELDAAEAAAKLGLDLQANTPELVEPDAPFRLLAMRHPILTLQQKTVVPNDVHFAPSERILVVSGPNAGGKTVTLTGVGLCALMARAGLDVPAEAGSTLPWFERVESAIGDDQDLARDLSTFSAHLTALRDIGAVAGRGTLVLIDEIGADTDPREGAAIALAVLEDFAEKGARAIITTHLEELKAVAVTDERYVNARVGFDSERMAPTYRLQYGTPGSSSAIDIARRVGLDPELCRRAEENLKTSAGPLGRALAALERQRDEADSSRRALDDARATLERERAQLEAERAAVRERERSLLAEGREALLAEVERTRGEVAQVLAELQARPSVKAAAQAQASLAALAEPHEREVARERAGASVAQTERLPEGARITVGMRVRVPNLGEAQVLEVSGEEATVAAGPMKVRRKVADLVPLKGAPKATARFGSGRAEKGAEKLRKAAAAAGGSVENPESRLDVRGMRADEALRAVETFLDRCYGEGRAGALIVHGLGTGALRASIRDYLAGSPYASHFRAGSDHEGGEGVTLVAFSGS